MTKFNDYLVAVKLLLEDAREELTPEEWDTLRSILTIQLHDSLRRGDRAVV